MANTDVGGSGIFGSHVEQGTSGDVVDTRTGLFESYATVKFANGLHRKVRASDLKKDGWW